MLSSRFLLACPSHSCLSNAGIFAKAVDSVYLISYDTFTEGVGVVTLGQWFGFAPGLDLKRHNASLEKCNLGSAFLLVLIQVGDQAFTIRASAGNDVLHINNGFGCYSGLATVALIFSHFLFRAFLHVVAPSFGCVTLLQNFRTMSVNFS